MQYINLSHNKLTSLPEEIYELPDLKYLVIWGNFLPPFDRAVPFEVKGSGSGQLTNLQNLSEEERFSAALEDAKNGHYYYIQDHLQDYHLTEEHLFPFALEIAKRGVSFSVQNLGLTQQHEFALLLEMAKNGHPHFTKPIESYGFAKEEERFALALELMESWKKGDCSEHRYRIDISKYNLTEEHRYLLAMEMIKNVKPTNEATVETSSFRFNIQNPDYKRFMRIGKMIAQMKVGSNPDPQKAYEYFKDSFTALGKAYPAFATILDSIPSDTKKFYQQLLLAEALANLTCRNIPFHSEYEAIIKECAVYPNFELASTLVDLFGVLPSENFGHYQSLAKRVHTRLPMLFLIKWGARVGDENVDNFIAFLQSPALRKSLRDANTGGMQRLLYTLRQLDLSQLSDAEKLRLITSCAKPEEAKAATSKEFFDRISLMGALIMLEKEKELAQIEGAAFTQKLNGLMISSFKESIGLQEIEDFTSKYSGSFGAMRIPHAILTYMSRLKTLNNVNVPVYLKRLISGVLNGTFIKDRYEPSTKHLDCLSKKAPRVYESWQRPLPVELVKIEKDVAQNKFSFLAFLKQKILDDHHLPLEQVPYLLAFLQGRNPKKQMEEVELLLGQKEAPLLRIQLLCMQLAQEPENASPLIQEICSLAKGFELQNDMEGLLKSKEIKGKLTVVDTDLPEDLLLCGTEVMGSCQRIDGDPYLNLGLLGYLLDGKIRIVALKDHEGKIVARSILKLLWSKKGAVLFQERIYPDPISTNLEEALNAFVEKKARSLQVPLYRGAGTEELFSLDSRAPEYEDGGVGLSLDGHYQIKAKRIF